MRPARHVPLCLALIAGCASPIAPETTPAPATVTAPAPAEGRIPLHADGLGPMPWGAELDLARLAGWFPDHQVREDVRYGESDPDYPIPVFVIAFGRRDVVTLDHEDGALTRITVTAPHALGPGDVRVGMTLDEARPHVDACEEETGLEVGVFCTLIEAPRVRVFFSNEMVYREDGALYPVPAGSPYRALALYGD